MNEILQKRIEEAADEYIETAIDSGENNFVDEGGMPLFDDDYVKYTYIEAATFALQNQWISVSEALPEENRIIAKLSKSFCNKDNCYEILCRIAKEYVDLKHPDGYYDLCGENVPTSAITHWIPIPQIGGEK